MSQVRVAKPYLRVSSVVSGPSVASQTAVEAPTARTDANQALVYSIESKTPYKVGQIREWIDRNISMKQVRVFRTSAQPHAGNEQQRHQELQTACTNIIEE
jgi:hypothetical protein